MEESSDPLNKVRPTVEEDELPVGEVDFLSQTSPGGVEINPNSGSKVNSLMYTQVA